MTRNNLLITLGGVLLIVMGLALMGFI